MIRDYKNVLFYLPALVWTLIYCVLLHTTGPEEGHNIDKEDVQMST